jgi:hypothetical protein
MIGILLAGRTAVREDFTAPLPPARQAAAPPRSRAARAQCIAGTVAAALLPLLASAMPKSELACLIARHGVESVRRPGGEHLRGDPQSQEGPKRGKRTSLKSADDAEETPSSTSAARSRSRSTALDYVLRPSERAIANAERDIGCSLHVLTEKATYSRLTLDETAIIVTHMMHAHAKADPTAGPSYSGAKAETCPLADLRSGRTEDHRAPGPAAAAAP